MRDDVAVIDYAGPYAELHERLTDLLRTRPAPDVERVAPTTPKWRVRDVVAHLTGVCDDIVNGNMNGVASDAWTATQVEKRRDLPFDDVLTEWSEQVPAVTAQMRDVPIDAWGQMLADAATHEQDVRGALDAPGGRDCSALAVGLDWGIGTLGPKLTGKGKTLRVEHEAGKSETGSGDAVVTLRVTRFELARAMTGRRSRAQMRAYDADGPFDPDDLLLATFFTPPEADLVE